jgi:hypothetical protein
MTSYCEIAGSIDILKIHELSLSCCQLRDMSCLSHLTWLSLGQCPDMCDVHSLGDIAYLNIIDCRGIRDISALQNNRNSPFTAATTFPCPQ